MKHQHLSPTIDGTDKPVATCGPAAQCPHVDAPLVVETQAATEADAGQFAASFASAEPAMRALAQDELVAVNVDVAEAYTTASAAMPGLLALRDRLARLAEFDVSALDNLPVYSEAAFFAQAMYVQTRRVAATTTSRADDCLAWLTRLMNAVDALMQEGVLPNDTLENFRKESGNRPLALETVALVTSLRAAWPRLAGHTGLTPQKLDAAENAARLLLEAVSEKERFQNGTNPVTEQRLRAFTLFTRAYEEVRRGVSFLLWYSGNADEVAPSFFAGRSRSAHAADSAPSAPSAPSTPAAPATPSAAPVAGPVVAPAPVKFNATFAALSGDASKIPNFASAVPKPFANS